MSTEIKNTLFRFVTMRAPELSDENLKEKRFVFRNTAALSSVFDLSVTAKSNRSTNWQAMQNAAITFVPLTEKTLKTKVETDFLEFSIWVARNKRAFTTEELLGKLDGLSPALTSNTLKLLWDNLFYQVVTQKDFYVKETIMQLLIANHICTNIQAIDAEYSKARLANSAILETELIKNIVNAKVVLPKELFDESATTPSTIQIGAKVQATEPVQSAPGEEMKKFWANSEAKEAIDKNLKLRKELQKSEKIYQKEYKAAYNSEQEKHQAVVDSIMEEYQQNLEDTKRNWCAVRDLKNEYNPEDPCQQPPGIPQPKLPKLKFEFRNEIDFNFLSSSLSQESYGALLELLEIEGEKSGKSSSDYPVQDTISFIDVYNLIEDNLRQNSQRVIAAIPKQNATAISIGGVIVPVVATKTPIAFKYQICPKVYKDAVVDLTKKYVDFDMTLELPDDTWQISSVETDVIQSNTIGTSSTFNQTRTANSVILGNLFRDNKLLESSFLAGIKNIKITISFSNGAVRSFTASNWKTHACYSGILVKVNDPILGNENSVTNVPVIENNFIPSGFGVKQLGIADYKKVEQTVQGYIEGDVAHIENVMAREYKEKATRKLRRSENTTSVSTESEREQLSDTTSTDRFEMQSEVAKILQEDKDFTANASFGANWGTKGSGQFTLGTNVGTATHSTKEESNSQAITQAKEVTERAMERIVTKVKEERVTKIIEEFEENNKHGFDNTKGDKHVVGVYRWVDKIFKNQVINYGKRLMFEFMIPEPAKLHLLGMTENESLGTKLEKPIDPRNFIDAASEKEKLNLKDFTSMNPRTAGYWGSMYNADINPMPEQTIYIGKAFHYQAPEVKGDDYERAAESTELEIPEGYKTISALAVSKDTNDAPRTGFSRAQILVGDKPMSSNYQIIDSFKTKIPVSYCQLGFLASSVNISIKCDLLPEALAKWQQETFKAIIDAYEKALQEYNQKLAEENAIGVRIKDENPGFYRQIENIILRKNCISYIIDQNEQAKRTYGKNMFNTLDGERNFRNHEINVSKELDDYTAFSKFIEQAFEWEIMSYNFYPYYWGTKKDWASLYQYDNNDPLFRSFMQAGMARVIVTVRPGFEEAVNYYMQTGQIWNGGEVPVIEDKLFMSIVDELRQTPGQKEGKAWATRLPTALTILQAQSIGLTVTKALPFDTDVSDFEDPDSVPQSTELNLVDAQLGVSQSARIVGKIKDNQNIESKIVLKNLDGTIRDLTYCDSNGNWELNTIPAGKYELLLDANNDFPIESFKVTEGSKEQTVELSADQTLEINMTLKKL